MGIKNYRTATKDSYEYSCKYPKIIFEKIQSSYEFSEGVDKKAIYVLATYVEKDGFLICVRKNHETTKVCNINELEDLIKIFKEQCDNIIEKYIVNEEFDIKIVE